MLGMCRHRVAWLPIRMPASACPGTVLTATRTGNSGRDQRNPALMRAMEHSVSLHELHMRPCEMANHRRPAFEPSRACANPHMKFHIE